jgi:hypothetical protein
MKFDITLNGVKLQKEIPTGWEQVSFKQMLELIGANELKALSIFTGIEPEILKKANITGLEKLITTLSFITAKEVPSRIPKEICGYPVPLDLGFEAFGQYVDIKTEIDRIELLEKDKEKEYMKAYPLFCAIYSCKPYDTKVAESRIEAFNNAPCTEVLALGNFILLRLIALRLTTALNSQRKGATRMKRFLLALNGWRINMAFTVRYYFLKRKLRLTETK